MAPGHTALIGKIRKYHNIIYYLEDAISMSYDRVQHLVDVDESIFAAFVIDSAGNISELFVAPDSDLDKTKIEEIRSVLDIKSATMSERVGH